MFNININNFRRKSQSNGFLLIESLVTLIIVSFMSLYLSVWYIDLISYQKEIILRDKAINLGSSILEYIKVHKKLDSANNLPDYKNFEIKHELKKVSPNFTFVNVEVGWKSKMKTNSQVKLVGGFS